MGCGVMPREKINNAAEYIQQDARPLEPWELELIQPAQVSATVSEVHWKHGLPGNGDLQSSNAPGAWVPDEPITRDAIVFVNWRRDDWAQIGIEADPAYFRMAAENPDSEVVSTTRTSVYTPPLSRDELNKMIRALRRARDQVYGGDE